MLNVVGIVLGVALASFGEIHFSWIGFLYQSGGIVFEAMRLVLIQILLSGDGQKMDPLVSLYYYAPVCAVMNVIVALASEWSKFDYADLEKDWLADLGCERFRCLYAECQQCVPGT